MEEIFTLGRNGIERLQPAPALKRGHILHAYGYAGNLQEFAVTDGEKRTCIEIDRSEVNDVEDLTEDYFSAQTTYDKRIRPISKKFGIGFYYTEPAEYATEEQIQQGLKRAEQIKHFEQVREEQEKKAFAEGVKKCREKYGEFLVEVKNKYSEKEAAENLRRLLKREFSGVKFSVANSSGYYVRWTDGPTAEQVKKITSLFDDYVTDKYNPDLYDCVPTAFTSLYGSIEYLFTERVLSYEFKQSIFDELKKFATCAEDKQLDRCELLNACKGMPEAWEDIVFDAWAHTDHLRGWAEHIAYCLPAPAKEPKPAKATETDGAKLQYIDYSEKAFAIIGDTKAVSDKLKELGGRFNFRLSCGAGWIFSKKNETEVRQALCI